MEILIGLVGKREEACLNINYRLSLVELTIKISQAPHGQAYATVIHCVAKNSFFV